MPAAPIVPSRTRRTLSRNISQSLCCKKESQSVLSPNPRRDSAYFESPDDVEAVPASESPSTKRPSNSSTAMAKDIQTVVRTDFNIMAVNDAIFVPKSLGAL
jgi:hypothetical protein